ncbi:MAG: KH domain-containing protein [Clostridia bacterium]|nr:KH domain-containing protein [Clostridia bacterium]
MIKEARGFGNTIDEAKENAIAQLNASELDDIQFDVIAMPKKKVLGLFGGSKAEVRAFIEVPEKKNKPAKKNQPKPKNRKEEAPKKEAAPAKPPVEKASKEEKKAEAPQKPQPRVSDEYSEPVDQSEIPADSNAGRAVAYIKTVLNSLDCKDIDIKVASRENGSLIHLNGEDLSVIIGRRGETLDALQYLACLAANNGGGHYKISINIGNYRERREETLTNLAKRISAQVLKTGKSRTLEPMNPYERRIIHTAVQEIEGVVSNSYGEGVGRRVIISPEGAEVRPPRYNDRRRSGGRRPSSKPRTQAVASDAPIREPKRDSDTPLYGKIN